MARWTPKALLEEAERLRAKTPVAAVLSERLFEAARETGSEALEALAIEVDGTHCQTGREISPAGRLVVCERAARILKEES